MARSIAIRDNGGDRIAQARLQRPLQTAASSRTHNTVVSTDIPAHHLQNTALQNTLVRKSLHVAIPARLQPNHSVTHPVSLKSVCDFFLVIVVKELAACFNTSL
jgi:hypothetical protein